MEKYGGKRGRLKEKRGQRNKGKLLPTGVGVLSFSLVSSSLCL